MKFIVRISVGTFLLFSITFGYVLRVHKLDKIGRGWTIGSEGGDISIWPRDPVDSVPDIRAVLGSPGRNIAVRGDTVVIISSPPSGSTSNPYNGIVAYYSFDGGHTYELHNLSVGTLYSVYPGLEWPKSWTHNGPLFFWQSPKYDGTYYSSAVYVAWDTLWPGGEYKIVELPNSRDWDAWFPSADASGDTIIVCAVNVLTTYFSFIWRSYDGGTTWDSDTFFTQGSTGWWHDTPIPRIGHDGYVAVITDWIVPEYGWDAITPFFCESMDGGRTWIDTINLWDASGWSPYDSAGGWWYGYNFILDFMNNDRPHIAWKFSACELEFGDCWHLYPQSGSPGNWSSWNMQLLVGEGDGTPVATEPFISFDPLEMRLVYIYLAPFIISETDTFIEIGVMTSDDGGVTWEDHGPWGMWEEDSHVIPIDSTIADSFSEDACELPSLLLSETTGTPLHIVFTCGNFVYHAGPYRVAVKEDNFSTPFDFEMNLPSLVSKELPISFSLSKRSPFEISLFDVTGRKIYTLLSGIAEPGSHSVVTPVDRFTTGVYFIRVVTDEGEKIEKIEILH